MVKFSLNGEPIELTADMSVEEFLRERGYELRLIALERDREILPRGQWSLAMMSEGASYEVVEFVGGG